MKAHLFSTQDDEHEVIDEASSTWEIRDWRRLPRKSHGPIFQAGGDPWYGPLRMSKDLDGMILWADISPFR